MEEAMTTPRTKRIDGFRIQSMSPIHSGTFDAICEDVDFTVYHGKPCAEALVKFGMSRGSSFLAARTESTRHNLL